MASEIQKMMAELNEAASAEKKKFVDILQENINYFI